MSTKKSIVEDAIIEDEVLRLDPLDLAKVREMKEDAIKIDNEILGLGRAKLEIADKEGKLLKQYQEQKVSEDLLFTKLKEKYKTNIQQIDIETGEIK